MKKGTWLLWVMVITWNFSSGQGRANQWLMGNAGGGGSITLDFNQNPVKIDTINRILNFFETNATICDESGNLLFASNGVFIMNANNDTMMNGDSLNPGWFATLWQNYGLLLPQGNFAIPFPGDTNRYILFHETAEDQTWYNPYHLFYSIIDMQLDNGFGGVTNKNIPLITDTLKAGEITGELHANGRDWWVLVHQRNSNLFYKILVTSYGFYVSTQNIGVIRDDWTGQSVFSPDGNLFAHYNPGTDVDIYNFDRCTGMLSNHINIPINDSAASWGIAFSPNSKYLYVSSNKYVYQYDVTHINIASTQTTVAVWDGFYSPHPPYATTFFLAQLAPDGKIYICASNGVQHLHVINKPDSAGLACDMVQHGIYLNGRTNGWTIANHPNYYLGPVAGSICDSLTNIGIPLSGDFRFTVSPNPVFDGRLQIKYLLPQNTSGKFELFGINGKIVLSYALPPWSTLQIFNISDLSDGLYVAVISSKGMKSFRKVGVMK